MARYRKGANAERELIQMFFDKGYSVVRVAGSGATSLPSPDCLALSKEKKMAFECKSWKSKYLNISRSQAEELISWADRANIELFFAWRLPRRVWRFLKPEQFRKNKKNFSISLKEAMSDGLTFSVLVGEQKRLPSSTK